MNNWNRNSASCYHIFWPTCKFVHISCFLSCFVTDVPFEIPSKSNTRCLCTRSCSVTYSRCDSISSPLFILDYLPHTCFSPHCTSMWRFLPSEVGWANHSVEYIFIYLVIWLPGSPKFLFSRYFPGSSFCLLCRFFWSSPKCLSSGVHQGLVLGLLFFFEYIHSLDYI